MLDKDVEMNYVFVLIVDLFTFIFTIHFVGAIATSKVCDGHYHTDVDVCFVRCVTRTTRGRL